MFYVLSDYCAGGVALFDSEKKAKDFVKQLNANCFEETGYGYDTEDYSIKKVELNPDFDKWIHEIEEG